MSYTSAYIQERLDKGGRVVLPEDSYSIDKTLMIGSNTELVMSPGVKLLRNTKAPVLGTIPGSKNIIITGGTIVGHGPKIKSTDYGNLTYVFHSKGVTFRDVIFEDTLGSHSIEINASEDISVLNCKFLGYNVNPNTLFREAIQIDFAAANTLPEFPTGSPHYDLKCCDGIKIIGCTFDKSSRYPAPLNAIGTHSQPNTTNKSKNIIISKNTAKGVGGSGSYGLFVHCINFENVIISDNIVEGYARFVRIYSNGKEYKKDGTFISDGKNSFCSNIRITNNIVKMFEFFKTTGVYAISNNGIPHRNIHVDSNTFLSDDLVGASHFITDFNNSKNIYVSNNTNNRVFAEPFRVRNCVDHFIGDNNIIYEN